MCKSEMMKKPAVNIWAIVYFLTGALPLFFLCLWAYRDGWFPTDSILLKHPDPEDSFYSFNRILTFISAILLLGAMLPVWIIAFGQRKPWIWITTLVFIALGMSGNPIMGIPVLIFWIKPENKTYYKA